MTTRLEAGFVHTSDEDGIVTVGFADRERDPRHYLLLQRAHDVDAAERARGEDDVHLEFDGEERSGYGAVERVEVAREGVLVLLHEDAAAELDTDPEIQVSFALDDAAWSSLVEGLRVLWEHRSSALVVKR